MTHRELAALVDSIELRRWPWKIEIRTTELSPGVVHIKATVLDRDSGVPTTFAEDFEEVPSGCGGGADDHEEVVAWIFERVKRHVVHELQESFCVGGVRVFDPHGSNR